jgi:hypothetical protein
VHLACGKEEKARATGSFILRTARYTKNDVMAADIVRQAERRGLILE